MKAINTALVAIRRSPYQSILTTIIITITFFIAYCFSFITIGSEKILSFFETQPQVIAFFNLEASGDDLNRVSEIMKAKEYVSRVKIVGKKEALEIYQRENQDKPLLLELVTEDILPASIEVAADDAKNLEEIRNNLEEEKAIEEVVLQEDVIGNLIRWTNAMRLIGLFSLIILVGTSFLMIVVTISMKVSSKRKSIKIMKFIGANDGFISRPYLFEAVINSLFASTIAFAFYCILILYSTPWMASFLTGIIDFPISWLFFLYQFLAAIFLAASLGTVASFIAVKRMLKK